MKKNVPLFEVQVPSAAIESCIVLDLVGRILFAYDYYIDGLPRRAGLVFYKVRARRLVAGIYATIDLVQQAYDCLVEELDSPWVAELQSAAPPDLRYWEMHHYRIFLDGVGAFEAVAAEWRPLPEAEGRWGEDFEKVLRAVWPEWPGLR